MLLDLTNGSSAAYVALQIAVAAAAWGLLAGEVAATQTTPLRRWAMAIGVLGFSLTTPIVQWDRLVLTETIGLALLAASVALVLHHLRTGRAWPLVVLVVVAVVWMAGRDTVAATLISGAVCAVVLWVGAGRRGRLVPVVATALVVIAGIGYWGATSARRGMSPMANTFSVRVMPYPDRVRWFMDHGMPEGERFLDATPLEESDPISNAPVVPISRDDLETDPWWVWLRTEGTGTYIRFLATHPATVVTEPFRRPRRVMWSDGGYRVETFRAPDRRTFTDPLTSLLWWPTSVTLVVLVAAGLWWNHRGRPTGPLWTTAALATVTGVAYGVTAWYFDGLEADRHTLVGWTSLRIAVLLVIAALVAGDRPVRQTGAAPRTGRGVAAL